MRNSQGFWRLLKFCRAFLKEISGLDLDHDLAVRVDCTVFIFFVMYIYDSTGVIAVPPLRLEERIGKDVQPKWSGSCSKENSRAKCTGFSSAKLRSGLGLSSFRLAVCPGFQAHALLRVHIFCCSKSIVRFVEKIRSISSSSSMRI